MSDHMFLVDGLKETYERAAASAPVIPTRIFKAKRALLHCSVPGWKMNGPSGLYGRGYSVQLHMYWVGHALVNSSTANAIPYAVNRTSASRFKAMGNAKRTLIRATTQVNNAYHMKLALVLWK